jgi:hypothetical protein
MKRRTKKKRDRGRREKRSRSLSNRPVVYRDYVSFMKSPILISALLAGPMKFRTWPRKTWPCTLSIVRSACTLLIIVQVLVYTNFLNTVGSVYCTQELQVSLHPDICPSCCTFFVKHMLNESASIHHLAMLVVLYMYLVIIIQYSYMYKSTWMYYLPWTPLPSSSDKSS